MKIEVHMICRNERPIIEYTLRHFSSFCSRIFAYDDHSDDGTREILENHPLVVLGEPTFSGLDDEGFASIFDNARHVSPMADWIMCVDADELVYHPWIVKTLREVPDATKVLVLDGYDMISDHFPTTNGQIYDEIKDGVPDPMQCKPIVFRPEADIHFMPGRHMAVCNGAHAKTEIKLLHYRFLGREYALGRHARNYARMSETNKAKGHGVHNTPGWGGVYSERWIEAAMRDKRRVV